MSISRLDVKDEMSPPLQCAVTTITQQLSSTEFVEASLIEEKRELKSLDRIYGRDEEQKIILQTYHQTIHQTPANPSVLIIQGEEGIGKKFLVEQTLSQRVRVHDHGFFVHWKMHPIVNVPNFMTISSDNGFEDAFASLVHQVMASGESIIQQIQESFQKDIDENDRLTLAEMIPCIAPLLGPIDPSASNSAHVHASGRQLQIFSSLLRILASPTRPLVFFMDNLQYSESCNLRLLEYLLNTNEIQGIFFVLSIGPVQSDDVHQFVRSLHELSATSRTTVTIQLSELDAATTHCMIADMLHVDLETSAPLHTTLYSQIRGNPRRLLSWMNWMYLNQHLEWDRTQDKWHWDSHEILNGIESDLTARTNWNKLPFPIQELLIVSSCIGNIISPQYMEWIFSKPCESYLRDAMTHGWIIPVATNRNDKNVEYCFVSNSMRELAYSMILNNQRDSCHLNIGRKLWRKFNQSNTSCLHPQQKSLVLTQLLLGTSAMISPNERAATAALCLSVAEEEVKWSTFSTAATLLEKGIKLLGDWSWREDYDLTLALHNTSAEVNYVLGDFDTVQKRCQAIFHNARLVDHTLPACSVQISILSAAGNTDEALDVGVDVLDKIGEPIIDRPSTFYIARTLVRLCRLLRRVSPDTIRRLPLMTDSRKAAAMQILNHMIMSAHIGRESLVPILVSKLIELSIRYGLCNVSSVAFGWYGLILASQRKLDLAHQYGKLALELLDRFDSKQWLPRVHLCVYGGVFGCSQNIRDAIAPLSRGFDVGIETGDIEYALLNVMKSKMYGFYIGRLLPQLAEECEKLVETSFALKHKWALYFLNSMLHLFNGLINGDYKESMALLIQVQNNIEFQSTISVLQYWTCFERLILSYIMCDYDRALIEACAMQSMHQGPNQKLDMCIIITLNVMSQITGCPSNGPKRLFTLSKVRKRIATMKKCALVNPQLCLGMLHLAQAKLAQKKNKMTEASTLFLSSIALLGREKLLSVQPLACEEAARHMMLCHQKDAARQYFQESLELYKAWGANQKCALLKCEIEGLLS